MKLSRYNFLRQIDGITIFFNSMTCALAIVDENFLKAYREIENGSFDESRHDPNLIANMKSSGCIIEDDIDELRLIDYSRGLEKFDRTLMSLTIVPTLDCNFRCKYCFEEHRKGSMNQATQNRLIEFIRPHAERLKNLRVTWFGGEPLLEKEIIYSLSKRLLEICAEHQINFDATIITNGSLIEDSDIEQFKRCKIRHVQITIDGIKEVHDQRRRSIDGSSTFDHLLKIVDLLAENEILINVRVNIDQENVSRVDELLETMKSRIKHFERVIVNFGRVTALNEVCRSVESDCYNPEQFADIMLPLHQKVLEYGFKTSTMILYPKSKRNYCGAEIVNFFMIDSDGTIYKCWNDVGILERRCGNLFDKPNRPSHEFLEWIQRSPMQFEECHDCKVLPLCMGGCPHLARRSNDGNPVCDSIKFNIDRILRFYYERLKGVKKNGG